MLPLPGVVLHPEGEGLGGGAGVSLKILVSMAGRMVMIILMTSAWLYLTMDWEVWPIQAGECGGGRGQLGHGSPVRLLVVPVPSLVPHCVAQSEILELVRAEASLNMATPWWCVLLLHLPSLVLAAFLDQRSWNWSRALFHYFTLVIIFTANIQYLVNYCWEVVERFPTNCTQ